MGWNTKLYLVISGQLSHSRLLLSRTLSHTLMVTEQPLTLSLAIKMLRFNRILDLLLWYVSLLGCLCSVL